MFAYGSSKVQDISTRTLTDADVYYDVEDPIATTDDDASKNLPIATAVVKMPQDSHIHTLGDSNCGCDRCCDEKDKCRKSSGFCPFRLVRDKIAKTIAIKRLKKQLNKDKHYLTKNSKWQSCIYE